MTKTILIASVAALAITAPAQAQRPNRDDRAAARQEAKAQRGQARGGGEQRGQQARQQQPQREQRVRMERPQFEQRVRMERPQREQRVQMERPQRQQRVQMERPQREQRARIERQRPEQRVRMERPQREQRVQHQQQARNERVAKIQTRANERRPVANRQVERRQAQQHQIQQRQAQQHQVQQRQAQQRQLQQRQQADNRFNRQQQPGRPERQAERFAAQQQRAQQRFDRRQAMGDQRAMRAEFREQRRIRPQATVGQRLTLRNQQFSRNWYDNYADQRGRVFYDASPAYLYDYNPSDGYLYQVNRSNNLVTGLYPLLGGAFAVGRPLPIGYDNFNLPYGYRDLYYDTPDYYYRYGDGAIYRVDRDTQLIQTVAALLTGQSLGIGQRLPLGYDVYNVPYAYRDQYRDTNSMWYRYDDGMIYGVDPYSRMIQSAYPVSYGYTVGYPVPAYGGYSDYGYGGYGGYNNSGYGNGAYSYAGYGVPYDYRDLYYAAPGYNYQYANGGIYQVDPKTQLVSALVALVTGTSLGVGQPLPLGYDVYNVPSAYRTSYYDTPDAWYRYDDGYIYQVDPRTRIVQGAIPVALNGYAVGYPMPAYAGYSVPSSYSDLYYAQPGYDYRYANGGIYQVDPNTRMVNGVAALLTGTNLGVGQRLPVGYDVYNVPVAYRDTYRDTPDAWYRYNDGNIYRVDPQTRLIQAVINGIV